MTQNEAFVSRRKRMFERIKTGIAVIPTTNEIIRNQDSTYQYRYDSYFYYLTGFMEPESVLVLDFDNKKSILFCRNKDKEREIWDGFRYGVEGACHTFLMDEAYSIDELMPKLHEYMGLAETLYYTFGHIPEYDQLIIEQLTTLRRMVRRGLHSPTTICDINSHIAELRLIKDDFDIQMLTRSCEISVAAHIAAMQFVKEAKFEYEVEAKIMEVFYHNGARYPAYTTIVGGGKNACVLHYVTNDDRLNPGELLLVDAGSEYRGYAGDITRTYPINGKFSKAQRALYEIVLEANKAAINAVKVGVAWNVPSDTAIKILTQGLIDLGLLKGSLEDNIANNTFRRFYMHNIGHHLGLDVHDVGSYKNKDGSWRKYQVGMCTTIEPGLYIAAASDIPEEYCNIGIRIEDNILLTNEGVVNLTKNAPKEIADIEKLING